MIFVENQATDNTIIKEFFEKIKKKMLATKSHRKNI